MEMGLNKFKHNIDLDSDRFKEYYPFGTIPFINYWLKYYFNKEMQPIEIPKILRTEQFLNRDYKIVSRDEVPAHGKWFIKNVSRLKGGSFLGYSESWQLSKSDHKESDLFAISSPITILSEYRVYVIDKEIVNISCYDGQPTIFPNIDIIKEMVYLINNNNELPNSFTLDIAVTNKSTVVLEVHPFAVIGLYSTIWDDNLINAYIEGINWYKNNNYNLRKDK